MALLQGSLSQLLGRFPYRYRAQTVAVPCLRLTRGDQIEALESNIQHFLFGHRYVA